MFISITGWQAWQLDHLLIRLRLARLTISGLSSAGPEPGTMSTPPPPPVQVEVEDEDWLPDDFRPMSLRQLMWSKVKNAPLVGVGAQLYLYISCLNKAKYLVSCLQASLRRSARWSWLRTK